MNAIKPEAPAVFAYVWPAMGPKFPAVDCYQLTAEIPGHGARSTVTGKTIVEAGYRIPQPELEKAAAALREVAK